MVSLNLRDSVFTGESIPVALKTSVVMVRRHPDHLSLVGRCLITVAFCGLAATGSELSMSQDFQSWLRAQAYASRSNSVESVARARNGLASWFLTASSVVRKGGCAPSVSGEAVHVGKLQPRVLFFLPQEAVAEGEALDLRAHDAVEGFLGGSDDRLARDLADVV